MINPYFYLYYTIFKLTYKTNKDIIEWSSMITISVLIYFNFISLLILTIPKPDIVQYKYFVFYWAGLTLLIANYYIFIYKKKYVKIVNQYKKESRFFSVIGGMTVISYIILSAWYFIYLVQNN